MTTNEIIKPEQVAKETNSVEDDFLDETIIVAMTNEYRTFCLQIENLMIQFINSPKFSFVF